MEMAEYNITVNAYAPGIVGTAMWDVIDEELAKKQGKQKGEVIRHYVKELTALGRTSVPEDVAKLVSFLCSSDRYVVNTFNVFEKRCADCWVVTLLLDRRKVSFDRSGDTWL